MDPAAIKGWLRTRLPEYMVPSWIVPLERFPLTSTGKIDRAALPVPTRTVAIADAAPRGPVEELIAGAMGAVLGSSTIDRTTDFFEAGGHSLRAMQLVARIADSLGADVPVRWVFEYPSVAELAAQIEQTRHRGSTIPERRPLVAVDRHDGLPLSFAQERLWFLDQLEPGRAVYNMPAAVTSRRSTARRRARGRVHARRRSTRGAAHAFSGGGWAAATGG